MMVQILTTLLPFLRRSSSSCRWCFPVVRPSVGEFSCFSPSVSLRVGPTFVVFLPRTRTHTESQVTMTSPTHTHARHTLLPGKWNFSEHTHSPCVCVKCQPSRFDRLTPHCDMSSSEISGEHSKRTCRRLCPGPSVSLIPDRQGGGLSHFTHQKAKGDGYCVLHVHEDVLRRVREGLRFQRTNMEPLLVSKGSGSFLGASLHGSSSTRNQQPLFP